VGAHRLGHLYGEGADAAASADDEDTLFGLDLAPVTDGDQRGHAGNGHCGGLLEGQVPRLRCEPRRTRTSELGEGTLHRPVHVVAGLELPDAPPDRLDRAGDVPAADPDLRGPRAEAHDAHQVGTARHKVPNAGVHTRGPHPDQHLIVACDRRLDLAKREDIRISVPVLSDCLNGPPLRWRDREIRSPPKAC
jgi:hypothetical protein